MKSKAISEQPDSILSNTCRAKITQMISRGGSTPEANSTIFPCYHIGHDGISILIRLRSLFKLWFSAKAVQFRIISPWNKLLQSIVCPGSQKDQSFLEWIKRSTASWSREWIVLMQLHLKYCMQFWVPQ